MPWKRHNIIYKKAGSYSCFPDLSKQADGTLVAAVTERKWPSHSSTGQVRVFLSRDGEEWEETGDTSLPPLWPGATGKFRTELPDGTWLDVGAGGLDGHADAPGVRPVSERSRWEAGGCLTADHEKDDTLFYVSGRDLNVGRSVDGGRTWERQSIPAPEGMRNLCGFRGLRLNDGTLLFPVGGRFDLPGVDPGGNGHGPWRQWVARSADDGRSWEWVPMVEDAAGAFTEETSLLELPGNRVLAMTRCHRPGPTGYLWQQWSADGGRSWSEPVETRVWGYPCHLLHLRDGGILCSYGYRFKPAGIRAVVSPNGWFWDTGETRVLRDDGGAPALGWGDEQLSKFEERGVAGADLGYPLTEQLEDGSLVTAYYITGPDRVTHAAATRWRLEGELQGGPARSPWVD